MLSDIRPLECIICKGDIDLYYTQSSRVLTITYQMMDYIMKNPSGLKALSTGRVVIINNLIYRNVVGVIVKSVTSVVQTAQSASRSTSMASYSVDSKTDKTFSVLIMTDHEKATLQEAPTRPVTHVGLPPLDKQFMRVELFPYSAISIVTSKHIKIDPEIILNTKHPNDLHEVNTLLNAAAQEWSQQGQVSEFDWSKIRQVEFQQLYREKQACLHDMQRCQCRHCPDLLEHVVYFYLV